MEREEGSLEHSSLFRPFISCFPLRSSAFLLSSLLKCPLSAPSLVSHCFPLLAFFLPLVTSTANSIPFKLLLITILYSVVKQSGDALFLFGIFCHSQQISIEIHE